MFREVSEQVLGSKLMNCAHMMNSKCMKNAYMWISNRLKSSQFMGMHSHVCSNVLLELKSTNRHRLSEHGIRAITIYAR